MANLEQKPEPGKVSLQRANDSTLVVALSGPWHLQSDMPPASLLIGELNSYPPKRISFDSRQLTNWDSGLVSFLTQVSELCRERGISQDREGLPKGLKRLVELAEAVPEKKGARSEERRVSLLQRIGDASLGYGTSVAEFLTFLGEVSVAFAKFVRGKARYRRIDLLE